MESALLTLEKRFFCLSYISDRSWLESVLHADFSELGKSGERFGRQETIDALLACTEDRKIVIYNFSEERLTENCRMVHFITGDGDKFFYRTSIWIGQDAPQLRYHQALPIARPEVLMVF